MGCGGEFYKIPTYFKRRFRKDPAYLQFVRDRGCVVHVGREADAHHIRTRGAVGSDYETVGLCRECHTNWHAYGPIGFIERNIGVDIWKEAHNALKDYFIKDYDGED